jgi:tRNA (guanine-N7-)-methyltransferase
MSFGLGHGRDLDDAPGIVGVTSQELPSLPDEALTDPQAGFVDPRRWFPDPSRPLELEIGPGKGSFILETARANPDVNFLGIEWAREFYLYAADRVRRAGLRNVRLLRADASDFLRWRCPSGILSVIHLYFSDPWPKKKHHKNRVIQDRFLQEAHRTLIPGGELRVVTDHDELWEWDMEHFKRWTQPRSPDASAPFELLPFTPPEWVGEGQLVGTNYERKMCTDKPPHAAVLRKL